MKYKIIGLLNSSLPFIPEKTRIIIKPNEIKWLFGQITNKHPENVHFIYTNISGYLFLIIKDEQIWLNLHKKISFRYRHLIAPNTGDNEPTVENNEGYIYCTKKSKNQALKEKMERFDYTIHKPVFPQVLAPGIWFVPGMLLSEKEINIQKNLLKFLSNNLGI
ncbi:MAG: hypothetical protein PHV30_00400 [Candidatus Margulisbacteria bacterium]|nr:hypothetical protein [Candidatus Margulisiibacteriota bacterium]